MSRKGVFGPGLEIPPTPVGADKRTQDWMNAVSGIFRKLFTGRNRLVTAAELVSSGIAGEGPDGALQPGVEWSELPVAIKNLTANGAMDNIFLTWDAPSFRGFAHVEIWRSDTDDIGQAYQVGATAASVYMDPVGSGTSRYYWARAVNVNGVVGPWQGAGGVLGRTGMNAEYVMSVLTARTWQALTTYDPYQYIRPTTDNGYQYLCVDGGTSGAWEPSWPTTINATVNDGDVTWRCVAQTNTVPFAIGEVDGQPAVAIANAFIADASITNAKIGGLVADKITGGQIIAVGGIQVGTHLWVNHPNFRTPETGGPAGVFIGMHGGIPRLQISTAGVTSDRNNPDFYRRFTFDGTSFLLENVDTISSANGTFDDLYVDSLSARSIRAQYGVIQNKVTLTRYVSDAGLAIGDPSSDGYLRLDAPIIYGEIATGTSASGIIGNGGPRFGWWPGLTEAQRAAKVYATVPPVVGDGRIIPFNESSNSLFHCYDESVGFRVKITSTYPSESPWMDQSWFYFRLVDQYSNVLLEKDIFRSGLPVSPGAPITVTAYTPAGRPVDLKVSFSGRTLLIVCEDDGGAINYTAHAYVGAVVSAFYDTHVNTDRDHDMVGTVTGYLQMVSPHNGAVVAPFTDPGSPLEL